MKLKELASLLKAAKLVGDGDTDITGIELNSYDAAPGTLYCCVPAVPNLAFKDRHQYAADAVNRGAAALLLEYDVDADVPKLFVQDVRYAMAVITNHLYGYPSRSLNVIALTGTNGKTTTAHLIEHILRENGHATGLMGNLGLKIKGQTFETTMNTQDSPDLQRSFLKMKESGVTYCVMEATSQGLELGRVLGTQFRTAVFTNLTQDHLDFHVTMDRYQEAKGLLFSRLGNTFGPAFEDKRFAVLNADDPASGYFRRMTAAQVLTYGIEQSADVKASELRITPQGTSFKVDTFQGSAEISMKLIGRFNVYNALAAITTTLAENIPLEAIRASLGTINPVEGRMEVIDVGQPFGIVVDYAHTPDGLENALSTIKEITDGKVITVFGCGGDRDRKKRPVMGRLAAQYSDYVLITSDNPRTEDPESILKEIEPGLLDAGFAGSQYDMIVDRRTAIQKAIEMSSPGDVVFIAGKGHETYQIIGSDEFHFDDREEARSAVRGRDQ